MKNRTNDERESVDFVLCVHLEYSILTTRRYKYNTGNGSQCNFRGSLLIVPKITQYCAILRTYVRTAMADAAAAATDDDVKIVNTRPRYIISRAAIVPNVPSRHQDVGDCDHQLWDACVVPDEQLK